MNTIETLTHPASSTVRTLEHLVSKYRHLITAPVCTLTLEKPTDLRRMTKFEQADAIIMFHQGTSPQHIADQLGFSCAAITGLLHRTGNRQRLTT